MIRGSRRQLGDSEVKVSGRMGVVEHGEGGRSDSSSSVDETFENHMIKSVRARQAKSSEVITVKIGKMNVANRRVELEEMMSFKTG